MYATLADLATYMFVSEEELPSNSERSLFTASNQIEYLVLNNYNSSNLNHIEAIRNATCAQAEYLIENPNAVYGNEIESFSSGKTSAKIRNENLSYKGFSNMAINFLNKEGLLYRGAKLEGSEIQWL